MGVSGDPAKCDGNLCNNGLLVSAFILSTGLIVDYYGEAATGESESNLPAFIGRILCRLGIHNFRVVDVNYSFGSGSVQKVECRRCGAVTTRKG